jgi:capsular polysaccharide transport system permease protein
MTGRTDLAHSPNSTAQPAWIEAVFVQLQVIGAIILRETHTRFGRTRIGVLWLLIEPVAHAVMLGILYFVLGRRSPLGGSVPLFFMTGLMPYFLWNKVSNRLVSSFISDRPLLSVPLVSTLDILIARAALEGAAWTVVCLILFTGLVGIGYGEWPADLQIVAAASLATFCLGFGVGSINATLTALFPSWQTIYFILMRPLYLASGVFYLVDQTPDLAYRILIWNPVVHSIEWFRTGFYAGYTSISLDRAYLVQWALYSCVIGLAMERLFRRKIRSA